MNHATIRMNHGVHGESFTLLQHSDRGRFFRFTAPNRGAPSPPTARGPWSCWSTDLEEPKDGLRPRCSGGWSFEFVLAGGPRTSCSEGGTLCRGGAPALDAPADGATLRRNAAEEGSRGTSGECTALTLAAAAFAPATERRGPRGPAGFLLDFSLELSECFSDTSLDRPPCGLPRSTVSPIWGRCTAEQPTLLWE